MLLFDRRGEGEGDGDPNLLGWHGERDVHAAVAFLQRRPDVDPQRIGGIGASMGGETMIEAAAESTALKAIVSEGGSGRSVRDDFANGHVAWDERVGRSFFTAAAALFTSDLPPADLKSLVPKISASRVLHLHGERGQPERSLPTRASTRSPADRGDLGGPGLHAHGRHQGAAAGVRAACRLLLRPQPRPARPGRSHEPRPFRTLLLSTALLALAVVLYWHPPGGQNVFEGVSPDVDAWLFVRTALLSPSRRSAWPRSELLRGVEGRAATVSRVAVVLFLVFYTAYETTIGVGTGVLVDYANGLPPAEQAAVADAIQDYNRDWIVAEYPSIALIVSFFGWVVAMFAAASALRREGATKTVTALVAGRALFAIHLPRRPGRPPLPRRRSGADRAGTGPRRHSATGPIRARRPRAERQADVPTQVVNG